jgi:hypothetical protein
MTPKITDRCRKSRPCPDRIAARVRAAFIAIGIGWLLVRRYRLKRDQDRLRQSQERTFE